MSHQPLHVAIPARLVVSLLSGLVEFMYLWRQTDDRLADFASIAPSTLLGTREGDRTYVSFFFGHRLSFLTLLSAKALGPVRFFSDWNGR